MVKIHARTETSYFMAFHSPKTCLIFIKRLLSKMYDYFSSLSFPPILPCSPHECVHTHMCVCRYMCLCVLMKARLSLSTLTGSLTKSGPRLVASKLCWSFCLYLPHCCRCRCQCSHVQLFTCLLEISICVLHAYAAHMLLPDEPSSP